MFLLQPSISRTLDRLRWPAGASRAVAFFRWWVSALQALLPLRLQRSLADRRQRLVGWLEQDALVLRLERGDQSVEFDRVALEPGGTALDGVAARMATMDVRVECWLLLPSARVLRPQLSFPVEAVPRLPQMLVFEIDRVTPFAAEQVVFDHRLGEPEGGRVPVQLAVLPRSELASLRARLSGLPLDGVDVLDAQDRPMGLNLLPRDQRQPRRHRWRAPNLALGALLAGLVLASLWVVLERHRSAAAQLRAGIASLQAPADEARRLHGEVRESVDAANFLGRRIAEEPLLTDLLADLTRRLPDNTWLERLTVEGERVTMEGRSADAAALVAELQASPRLREVGLGQIAQGDARSRQAHFTLTAVRVVPASEPADPPGAGRDGR